MASQQLTIPMFPLNMVLLPGETKTLHIFEERYKQLVFDCITNNAHFGIPFVHQKNIEPYGIEVKITNVIKKHDNGEMDIAVEGVCVFKLLEFQPVLPPKLYGAGTVQHETDNAAKPSVILQDAIREYLWVSQQHVIPMDAFDNADLYSVARLLDLSNIEKYELLETEGHLKKERLLISKIKLFNHLIKTENDLKQKFILN